MRPGRTRYPVLNGVSPAARPEASVRRIWTCGVALERRQEVTGVG
jgi:hypothetical protein